MFINIVGLIVVCAIANWLVGMLMALVGATFVIPFGVRAGADGASEQRERSHLRAVALSHLLNHLATTAVVAVICIAFAATYSPAWAAWVVLGVFVVFMRLPHIIDATGRLVKADRMPAAAG